MKIKKILKLSILLMCFKAHAEDLMEVYQLALAYDPTLQAAYSNMLANQQALPISIARLMPNLSANYQTTGVNTNLPARSDFNTRNYNISLSQPIYRPELWAEVERARHVSQGALASYLAAYQDLMIRVANQYFNILQAMDNLEFSTKQREAFAKSLDQTEQRFEVGLIAITDVQEAKASFDNAVATEIAAKNALSDEWEKLREITCIPIDQIVTFKPNKALPLVKPIPQEIEAWVEMGRAYNFDIKVAKENVEQSKATISAQVAGHYPKFNVQASVGRNKEAIFNDLFYDKRISLNVAVPIFEGGGVFYRTREATSRYDQALKELEFRERSTDSEARQAYRGVLTAISSINARRAAVISNQSALEATEAAYEVGTRVITDVLDAQTQLLLAQRDYATSRYSYLLEGLRLKRAAGSLTIEDLIAVNCIILGKETQGDKLSIFKDKW